MSENPQATFSPGTFRPHSPLNARAIFAPVASIRSSATPTVDTNIFASKTGIHNNPTTTNTSFAVVPDMSVSLQANASVRVSFIGTFQTATANDTAGFAIFRDGRQISRTFQASSASVPRRACIFSIAGGNPVPQHCKRLDLAELSKLETSARSNKASPQIARSLPVCSFLNESDSPFRNVHSYKIVAILASDAHGIGWRDSRDRCLTCCVP